MDARTALIQSWQQMSTSTPNGLWEHATAKKIVGMLYRIMSDPINDVKTWGDVKDIVRALVHEVWAVDLPEEMLPHVVQAFESWVDHASTLAPTYINPSPIK